MIDEMKSSLSVIVVSCIVACSGGGSSSMGTVTPTEPPPTPNGNTLLVGGSVVTMNTDNALAEALAYNSEGEILAVGSEAAVSQAAGDGARRVS